MAALADFFSSLVKSPRSWMSCFLASAAAWTWSLAVGFTVGVGATALIAASPAVFSFATSESEFADAMACLAASAAVCI